MGLDCPFELYQFLQNKHSLVVSVKPKNISDIIEHSFWNSLKKYENALFLLYWLRGIRILFPWILTGFFNSYVIALI